MIGRERETIKIDRMLRRQIIEMTEKTFGGILHSIETKRGEEDDGCT